MQGIYFAHVHKAGGTSMCRMASFNHMTVTGGPNCNLQHAFERATLATGLLSEQCLLLQRMERANVSFVATEDHALPDVLFFAPRWRYVTILRNGAARHVSAYLHVRESLRVGGKAAEYDKCERLRREYPSPRTNPPPLEGFLSHGDTGVGFLDNFQTRYFAGTSIASKPDLQINETDLRAAECTLRKFDMVLRLEGDLAHSLSALGWNQTTIRAGTRNHADVTLTALPNSTIEFLARKNIIDDRLYQFAATELDPGSSRAHGIHFPSRCRLREVVKEAQQRSTLANMVC